MIGKIRKTGILKIKNKYGLGQIMRKKVFLHNFKSMINMLAMIIVFTIISSGLLELKVEASSNNFSSESILPILDSGTTNAVQFQVGDFDNDGDIDILTQDGGGGTNITFWQNDGNGSFTDSGTGHFKSSLAGLAMSILPTKIVDFDNDGDLDIYCRVSGASNDVYYKNDGTGNFTLATAPILECTTTNTSCYTVGDFDNDGDIDILTQDGGAGSNITFWKNDGSGSFSNSGTGRFTGSLTGLNLAITSTQVADYDNDGDLDIYCRVSGASNDVYYKNDGTGNFTLSTVPILECTTTNTACYDVGDFDNDGDIDVLTQDSGAGNNITFWENDGSGVFSDSGIGRIPGTLTGLNLAVTYTKISDLDNDGDLDIYGRVSGASNDKYFKNSNKPPLVTSITPTSNATNVGVEDNIILNLSNSSAVSKGTGTIYIKVDDGDGNFSNDTIFESFAVTDARISLTGDTSTSTITINPNGTFVPNTTYYLVIPPSAFVDGEGKGFVSISSSKFHPGIPDPAKKQAGNSLHGISDRTVLSFSTENIAAGVSSVAVSPKTAIVAQGGTQQLTVTVSVTGGTAQTVNWTSNGTASGVTVDGSGLVSVAANATLGDYTITATSTEDNSKSDTSTITVVRENAVTPVLSGPTDKTINVGESASLTVTAAPTGMVSLGYQWYSNSSNSNSGGNAISGATNATYAAPTSTAGTTYYYCIVTNTDNSATGNKTSTATSSVAKVVVNALTHTATLSQTTDLTFTGETVGYSTISPQSITVNSTGTGSITNLLVALSGTNASSFTFGTLGATTVSSGNATSFTIKPNDNLAAGTYTATVTLSGDNGISESFNVSFTVSAALTHTATLSQTGTYTFTGETVGYSTISPQSITVNSTGTGSITNLLVALSGTNASSFTLGTLGATTVSTGNQTSFTIKPNDNLVAGTYTATVTLTGDNGISESFNVSFTVNAALTHTASLSQTTDLTFTGETVGYSTISPESITVNNTGTGSLTNLSVALSGTNASSFTFGTLGATTVSSGNATSFTIKPNDNLAAGTYTATVTLTGDNGISESFNVSFTVNAASALTHTASLSQTTDITFTGETVGYSTISPQSIAVNSTGTGSITNLSVALSGTNANSFTLGTLGATTVSSGNTTSFTIKPNDNLAAGTYTATVTLTGDNGISESFNVSFTVSAAPVVPAVNSVAVDPTTASIVQGENKQLTKTVIAVGGAAETATWSSSDVSGKVTVDETGLVTVASDAAPGDYTITATSTFDTSKKGTATITVSAAPVVPAVNSVAVDPTTASIVQGENKQLTKTVIAVGGAAETATWSSSDVSGKVTVDETGLVTVASDAAPGDYTITATSTFDTSKKGTATITVTAAPVVPTVNSVAVDPTTASIVQGENKQLTKTVIAVGGAAETVTWSSSDVSGKVTVDETGLVTVASDAAPGDYTITATSTFDSSKKGTATITVTAAPVVPAVNSVAVDPTTASIVQGENKQLTKTVIAVGGAAETVTWSSSDASGKVTVDSNGLVTVASDATPGDYTITATSTFDTSKKGTATITVSAAPVVPAVNSVAVDPTTASIVQGENKQLTKTVIAVGGAAETVTWSSSDVSGKVTVDETGLVTVASDAAPGDYTITATSTFDTSKTGTATITVTAAPVAPAVNSVAVDPTTASIVQGENKQLTKTVIAVGGAAETVTWSSSDVSGKVTVDETGLVTVASDAAPGDYTITATSTFDTSKKGTATITVSAAPVVPAVNSVAVDPTTASIVQGENKQLTKTVIAVGGAAETVTWSSSDASGKVTVDETGLVIVASDAAPGDYTITATSTFDTSKTGTATITVTAAPVAPAVNSVAVDPTTASIVQGENKQLTKTVIAVGGAAETVTWSSSDVSGKVTVDETGLVTVASDAAPGDYTITATSTFDSSKKGTATITVSAAPVVPAVNSVAVDPTTASIVQGENKQLTKTVIAVGGAAETVTWSSSDASGKVTVDSNGLVTVASDATPGDYTITATSTFDTSKKGTATITVMTSAAVTYTLNYTAEVGGTIEGDLSQTVDEGSDGTTVTAVPDTGCHFVNWSDGKTNASRMDTNVHDDISVSAEFEIDLPNDTDTTTPAAVRISGNQKVDNTLEALLIDENGLSVTTSSAVTYKWYRISGNDADNGTLVGEGSTYKLISSDIGKYIKLVVSYIDKTFEKITSKISGNSSSGSSGSSGHSSSSTSSSNTSSTEKITVKVTDGKSDTSISKTVIERTTASDGTKKDIVTYTPDKAKETVGALTSEGKDTARIVATDTDNDVSETKVNIPKETLTALSSGNVNLQIETGGAIVSLPKESVQGLAQSGQLNGDLYFRLVPIKDETRQTEIKTTANQQAIIKAVSGNNGVQVLGTPMTIETNMSQRAVDIVLPLKGITLPTDATERQAFLNDLGVFIEHSDGEKVLEKGQVVEYAAGVFGIKFTVNKFSDFTIVKLNKNNQTGWKLDNGYWYFFDNAGTMITGWYKSESGDWVYDGKDTVGQWFHLGRDGRMDTGWFKDSNGTWYYLCDGRSYGALGYMETGWKFIDGKWYFLKSNGAMATGWTYVDGSWYYLYSDGSMAGNTEIDGYRLDTSGAWINN